MVCNGIVDIIGIGGLSGMANLLVRTETKNWKQNWKQI